MNDLAKIIITLYIVASVFESHAQTTTKAHSFNGTYEGVHIASQVIETDGSGQPVLLQQVIKGTGQNDLMGEVTFLNFMTADVTIPLNNIEMSMSDGKGNSIIGHAVGYYKSDTPGFVANAIITSGTGKYKGAHGYLTAQGGGDNETTYWSSKGEVFLPVDESEKEELAIRKVIEGETNSFYSNDLEAWSNYVVQEDYC